MATWVKANVVENRRWSKNLFSLFLSADVSPFVAGQFTKLGLEFDAKLVQRAYSFANPPQSKYIEIYATRVADGLLSPKLHALEAGDTLMISQLAYGHFTLNHVPSSEHLWLIATGTAIGPYLSILRQGDVWKRFRKVVLVRGVRFGADLSHQAEINALSQTYKDQFIVQSVVTKEPNAGALSGRITHSLSDGMLERMIGFTITPQKSQIMLCGNPNMIKDIKTILLARGLSKNTAQQAGQITTERYW